MIIGAIGNIVGSILDGGKGVKVIKGSVVLIKKSVLDFSEFNATLFDPLQDLLGQNISFQLVSSTVGDPNNSNRGVVGEAAYLEESILSLPLLALGESKFGVTFHWHESQGTPGAIIVKNKHIDQFFLKSVTIDDFPGRGRIHFVCNSWVYNVTKYKYDRIFFANDTYHAENTPVPLIPYRQEELTHLRGDNVTGKLQEWDRVYNYAYYNDLGEPDMGQAMARPVLGGSAEYPYPRRGKTGRPPTRTDPKSESRLPTLSMDIYVPRDERFGHIKQGDFLGYTIKAVSQSLVPALNAVFDPTPNEFDSFEDVLRLYEGGLPLPNIPRLDKLFESIPIQLIKAILTANNGQFLLKLPKPNVIKADLSAWRTDEEFARETLAGVNPVIISRLQEFPPTSKLDPTKYGNQNSTITAVHIEKSLDGLTAKQALSSNRLFILDHHDAIMPYLNRINSTLNQIYATRTLLFLKDDGTLKPVAIELSLMHPEGEQHGVVSKVFTPAADGVDGAIWQLAKAYVCVNDAGVHQLISHWLHTHATVEPFVIATNRHLSALHPINKLLVPHYRDTMNINALARQALINAGGLVETTVFPAKYAMEMSSAIYKSWKFTEQALPADLLKRGVAVADPTSPYNIRLLIKDYPYAVDGLAIWSAIQTWVENYCSIYYPTDAAVQSDTELQSWWTEIREVGHGDKKDEPWWPPMTTLSDLTQSCTTLIWVSSALHAAVNFGQYPYGGYSPNRPMISRRLLPEPGSKEYETLRTNPEGVFLKTIANQLQTIVGVALLEILSTHASDEVYLGQRDDAEWTRDGKAVEAFRRFGAELRGIEGKIGEMNRDPGLLNRRGNVEMPYTLLVPSSPAGGITFRGIPNSISI